MLYNNNGIPGSVIVYSGDVSWSFDFQASSNVTVMHHYVVVPKTFEATHTMVIIRKPTVMVATTDAGCPALQHENTRIRLKITILAVCSVSELIISDSISEGNVILAVILLQQA